MPILFRDAETRSTLNLKRVGAHKYAAHPTTDVLCYSYAVDDGPIKTWWRGDPVPPEFIAAANGPEWTVSAFNDQFERAIEEHIMGPRYGWPIIPLDRHRCSQAAAQALALPGSLSKAVDALELEHRKDDAGRRLMLKMSRPRKPKKGEDPNGLYWVEDAESLARLGDYNRGDVAAERGVNKCIGHLPEPEQAVWELDAIINSRGVRIDRGLVGGAVAIGTAVQAAIDAEIGTITNGTLETINQTEGLIAWLASNGVDLANIQKPTVEAALQRTDLSATARRVLELRRDGAHAAANKFNAMLAAATGDDRIRGMFKYCQAGTGRWASHIVQLQNLKKTNGLDIAAAVEIVSGGDLAKMQEQYNNPLSVIGEVARAAICAAPGHRYTSADFSGIESRVLAWLAGEQSKLALWLNFDCTGEDPYFKLGKQFGFLDDTARAKGKTADLAFGYAGGEGAYRKFGGNEATSEEVEKLKHAWRDAHPKVVQFWTDIEAKAKRAVANPGSVQRVNQHIAFCYDGTTFLRMKLPGGRCIAYPFPRLEPDKYGTALVFKDNAKGQFTDARAWKGLLTENAVQAVARDLLVAALQRLEAAGYCVIMHVHDEIVAEVPDGFGSEDEFLKIMTEVPEWAKGLPIAAKVRSGQRFCKTESTTNEVTAAEPPIEEDEPSDDSDDDFTMATDPEAIPFDDPIPRFTEAPPTAPNGHYQEPGSWAEEDNNKPRGGYASGEREWGDDVAEYIYKDQRGHPYLKVKRTSNKQFPQYCLDNGRWIKGKPPGLKIPYRLPELMAAPLDAWVHLFEGEKDADNGAALGLVATTHSEGAEGWSDELVPWFIGRRIVIHEDNDDAGRKRTRTIAAALKAKEIRALKYEDLPEHGDFSDWLDQGHTLADLQQRIEAAPEYESALEEWDAGEDDENVPPREWLLGNTFCREFMSSLLADGGVGKTAVRIAQLMACAINRELTGEHVFVRARVLLVSLEDSVNELRRRVKACRLHHKVGKEELKGYMFLVCPGPDAGKLMEMDDKGRLVLGALRDKLERIILRRKIDIISLDPFVKAHAVGENTNDAIDKVIGVLTELAHKYNIVVDAPHHVSKGQADPGNAQKGRGASAFVDAGRLVHTLAPMSSEEAKSFGIPEEERRYFIRMDKGKVNITPPARVAKWFKLVGVPLHNGNELYPKGDEVQTVEPWTPPEIWDNFDVDLQNAVLDTIEEGLPNGSRYSDHGSAKERAAWKVVIKHAPDKNEKQARDIINAWVKAGVLEVRDYEDPDRREPIKGLFVNAEKRPK